LVMSSCMNARGTRWMGMRRTSGEELGGLTPAR
jgi:hypothetical protein